MNDPSDRDLVLKLQNNDLEALGMLYKRYRGLVYRTAFAFTGDGDIAKDLLHDIFLRLYRFANHIDCDRPLEPWLYRMTANLCYTWMRRKRRGLSLLKEFAERLIAAREQLSLGEWVEEKEDWRQVQQAIFALALNQRIVVVLHYLNDLTIPEIAEILDIPEGTVKSRLHYGRRALQGCLKLSEMTYMAEALPELQPGNP